MSKEKESITVYQPMGRLTKKEKAMGEIVVCKHTEHECNDSCMKIKHCQWYKKAMDKLKDYEDTEEQGLLLKLPCKVGDTVWLVGNDFANDYGVRRIIIGGSGIDCVQVAKEIDGSDYWNSFTIDQVGKTVFFSQEEAERKLKERF